MKVERRPHPRGESGTKISLEEAAKRASEGRLDPRTRAWAIEKLIQAGYPQSKKAQAAALLDALRRERVYVPDPTDAEFMPSAACQLAGCEGLTFLGEDCDGLLIAFLSAAGSIGIEGAVVGHSYASDGQLSHVLAAIYDGNAWHTCDPSTDEPFGQTARATREKWLSVPGGMVMCDGKVCDRRQAPDLVRRGPGDFVGVGAPQEKGHVMTKKLHIESYVGPALRAVMLRQVTDVTQKLKSSWESAKDEHYRLQLLADELGQPLVHGRWTEEIEQNYNNFAVVVDKLVQYGDEGQSGRRQIAWDVDTQDTAILGVDGEAQVKVTPEGALELKEAGETTIIEPVGHPLLIAAGVGIIVGYVSTMIYAAIRADLEAAKLKGAQEQRIKEVYDDQVARGVDPEDAARNAAKFGAAVADATRPPDTPSGTLARIADVAEMGMYTVIAVGLLGIGGYAMVRLWPVRARNASATK